ncbi:2'-5' RNA ligase family protein [Streptomyces sp. NBC_00503]|uniref:2'-5' RNA ligase family protein n=1 Tax=Streptomyces sp. NBC_00503 TaxID=2903659 RepID=UPI002E80D66F|nr:2'-5' RNA ligase family protein [Streptomyces sp. NBC_00503]WUD83958.1 2'-5' RNA ligase family protein [Streptomyces sp. NBC_00503]
MADTNDSTFRAGQTALIVRIPEAEPVVGEWRDRLDHSARAGVPAHVSVLYPFLDESRITPSTLAALAALLHPLRAFDLRFERTGRFPGVLYLAPEPGDPLKHLTLAVAGRWPEAPPYGGRYPGVVPHLTVAQRAQEATLDAVETDLRDRLPFTARVRSVDLVAFDGTAWREHTSFALREPQDEREPEK